jgi:hypothetical protein
MIVVRRRSGPLMHKDAPPHVDLTKASKQKLATSGLRDLPFNSYLADRLKMFSGIDPY